jgi:anthranilate phosphoribosyltransferase
MNQVMAGEATSAQIAAFAVALRAKGEEADEVAGLVDAMVENATPLQIERPSLDIVGTGGDRSNTVNISTMSAVLAAAAGARVVKHGNRAASSQCGSADVLEALGVAIELSAPNVAQCVDELGIGFCFAPVFHPALRHAAAPRREIGVRTVFNVMGPLANPARPSALLVGCADTRLAPVMAQVLHTRGQRALVVRGDDGLDEVTTAGTTTVWDATSDQPSFEPVVLDAASFGIAVPPAGALTGGDAAYNASIALKVLSGEPSQDIAVLAARDAVVLNTALALVAHAAAPDAGVATSLEDRVAEHIDHVRAVLASADATVLLNRWAELSTRLASQQS